MLNFSKKVIVSLSVVTAIALSSNAITVDGGEKQELTKVNPLLEAYSNIALDVYSDTLKDAKALQTAIDEFSKKPTLENLNKAKNAWLVSRESYGQTEAFRLSNGPVDSEDGWINAAYGAKEGQINAWPLDENMIDYTIDENGKKTSGNIIDTVGKFNPGGEESKEVDVSKITVDAITELNENGGDANVASGYHAIEFLLWGQDQDYSNFLKDGITKGAKTAGLRPLKDFTTDKNAARRLAYLKVASEKLVNDLEAIKSAWEKNVDGTKGLYQAALKGQITGEDASKNIESAAALKQIIAGMGVFVKSELANERIAVAVLTPSEEDEHSCFSDNTHRDIVNNYLGFKNVLTATYKGKKYGTSLLDATDTQTKERILALMKSIEEKINSIDNVAKTKEHFDYQIRPESSQSKVIVKLKNELRKLGDEMVNVATANNISLSTDDVTDPDETKL
ncbi:MAG: imelysin family protein [Aliarcobacter sp.]|nr:imelysin family protein [Aliarcobacter sp.]